MIKKCTCGEIILEQAINIEIKCYKCKKIKCRNCVEYENLPIGKNGITIIYDTFFICHDCDK